MIDFRYHIVSIVAIFLALAVGIVLGAGPLQQQIGETLNQQVANLRREKIELRDELALAQGQVATVDEILGQRSEKLLAGELRSQSVLLLVLPGADRAAARDLSKVLLQSGAKVTGQVRLEPSWVAQEPERISAREKALAALPQQEAKPTGSLNERLAAAVLVPKADAAAMSATMRQETLSTLQDAGLIDVDQKPDSAASSVVIVSGGATTSQEATKGWAELASTVARQSAATVLAGPLSSTESGGQLAVVRGSDRWAAQISTVDGADRLVGWLLVALTLGHDVRGVVDHFGLGPGASAAVPPPVGRS